MRLCGSFQNVIFFWGGFLDHLTFAPSLPTQSARGWSQRCPALGRRAAHLCISRDPVYHSHRLPKQQGTTVLLTHFVSSFGRHGYVTPFSCNWCHKPLYPFLSNHTILHVPYTKVRMIDSNRSKTTITFSLFKKKFFLISWKSCFAFFPD